MREERWLLPVGIEEILPSQARVIERLRRRLLDIYESWGYEFVIPPLVDYLDSLLTGTGRDLELRTFTLTDQLSGRTLGARADMTPQVARIDAHHLRCSGPTRLCYLDTVLHTRSNDISSTRSPLQIGAEIYGHSGVESDVEILRLLMLTLEVTGIGDVYLDLGHVGIFRALASQAGLDRSQEMALFEALQRKAVCEIEALVGRYGLSSEAARMMCALAELNGDDALDRAATELAGADAAVRKALEHLQQVAEEARRWLPEVPVHFDLAELRGYQYKTGVVFAAFVPGSGQEIARGGRYDDIGRVFGRSRPAVGFSSDLKRLLRLGAHLNGRDDDSQGVLAPWSSDPDLQDAVASLRHAGRRVVTELPRQGGSPRELRCSQRLERHEAGWVLVPVNDA